MLLGTDHFKNNGGDRNGNAGKKIQGGAVKAVVFVKEIEKNSQLIKIKKISIQMQYMNSDGEWKSTNSYDTNDCPNSS